MFMLKSTHEAAIKHLVETRNKALTDLSGATFKVESLESDLRAANKDADEWKGAALRCGEAVERLETEIAALKPDAEQRDRTISGLRAQLEAAEQVIAALKPDAEAMRAKRKRDREQQAAKKEGKKPALPTATKAKVTAKKGVGK